MGAFFCYVLNQGSLVERELSAQLTEGLLDVPVDDCAHFLKMVIYLIVGEPQNRQMKLLQKSRSLRILLQPLFRKMLGTVQLDHEICLRTVEINDIGANDFLAGEL